MTMEVPPFLWPKPALQHYRPSSLRARGAQQVPKRGVVKWAGIKLDAPVSASAFFPVMLDVGKPKWGAFTRLETRTKESNRRARERILLPVPLSYWKGIFLVCTFQCPTPAGPLWVEFECACLDPKGGELCLNKVKPGETQVEACSDADVQIARMIWVSERKTHRTT